MASIDRPGQKHGGVERRASPRYAVELEVAYKVVRRSRSVVTGSGRTVNISAGGVLFEATDPLPAEGRVELAIRWPMGVAKRLELDLCVVGRIVRSFGNCYAIQIQSSQFRSGGIRKSPGNHAD